MIFTSINAFAIKEKSKQAPAINYTLSETEDTWNPITVTLDITDDEKVVDVRYVRATCGSMNAAPYSDPDLNIASASYDIDCESLFFGEDYFGYDELGKIFGTERAACIAQSYYTSAFESYYNEKDELLYEDKSIPVKDGKFSVCYNDMYIIYAEDRTGNKSFRIFKIENIKEPSANVDLNIYSDFSGEYMAEARLKVTANPNSPVRKIYLCRDSYLLHKAGGAFTDFIQYWSIIIDDVKRRDQMLSPVDGVYYLRDPGKYYIFFEDTWGGIYIDTFELTIDGTAPELEVNYTPYDSKSAKVDINAGESSIAKIEYVECNDSITDTFAERTFTFSNNRTVVEGNSFIADYEKKYIVRAISTDGGVTYRIVKAEAAEESYIYEINHILLLSEGGMYNWPPQNKSFITEVNVNKKTESDSEDYLFVAAYDKNGALLDIEYIKEKFAVGECSYRVNIPEINKEIGSIKAFVWSDFTAAEPLSKTKTLQF